MLHFYLLDALHGGDKTAEELTDEVTQKSSCIFDLQTVRGKCNEYVDEGIFLRYKSGKAFRYALKENPIELDDDLLDAVKFFQSEIIGVVGNYILENFEVENDLFAFKHHYIAHTLEDGVVCDILSAIRLERCVELSMVGSKSGTTTTVRVFPIKIICSHSTGRRYLCGYIEKSRRFSSYRLDTIKSVSALQTAENADEIRDMFNHNIDKVWGVSFDGSSRNHDFSVTLHIDEENEPHIKQRILRESRGGALHKIGENTFRFTKSVFDANEAMPWIKTFLGRIIKLEAEPCLVQRFHSDVQRMAQMYGVSVGEEENPS